MDIKEALLQEHSKKQALLISHYIGDNPQRFNQLMNLFFNDAYRVVQRAAWILSHVADTYPYLIRPHLPKLIENLGNAQAPIAVKRNTVRVLRNIEIPEELLGILANYCFTFLADPKEAIAVKVHAMTVLSNLCEKEPDLANELILLIEEQMPYATSAFQSMGRKVLKKLKTQ